MKLQPGLLIFLIGFSKNSLTGNLNIPLSDLIVIPKVIAGNSGNISFTVSAINTC